MASRGPRKAPAVSKAWRRPKAAPWTQGGVMSAIIASRDAPRMPLPMRSMNLAARTDPTDPARAKNGLETAQTPLGMDPGGSLLKRASRMPCKG
jgi:hypothetical protein